MKTLVMVGIISMAFSTAAMAVDTCGTESSAKNPYPCCTNANGTKGNCVWWTWKAAMEKWGKSPVAKGNANMWLKNMDAKSFKQQTSPVENSIAVSTTMNASYGHVAWVTKVYEKCDAKNKNCVKTIDVTEMNCDDKYGSGKKSTTYAASKFQGYILPI